MLSPTILNVGMLAWKSLGVRPGNWEVVPILLGGEEIVVSGENEGASGLVVSGENEGTSGLVVSGENEGCFRTCGEW